MTPQFDHPSRQQAEDLAIRLAAIYGSSTLFWDCDLGAWAAVSCKETRFQDLQDEPGRRESKMKITGRW